ncbi:MAG: ATP-binding protein [Candidatus Kuenenia sp.]|nr:ATP-binding protein [Candidatus Kuenenia sp.]
MALISLEEGVELLREKIFEKYFQMEPVTGKKRYGMGIGLAFCKIAVEAQGGAIWVESEEGKGAAFKIELGGVLKDENPTAFYTSRNSFL